MKLTAYRLSYRMICFSLAIKPLNVSHRLLSTRFTYTQHCNCISIFLVLEFHHDENNEARWLIAGSHDRKVKFFDTHNVFLEISTTLAHSRIVAGCWPIHWTTFLMGIDNAYSLSKSISAKLAKHFPLRKTFLFYQ